MTMQSSVHFLIFKKLIRLMTNYIRKKVYSLTLRLNTLHQKLGQCPENFSTLKQNAQVV